MIRGVLLDIAGVVHDGDAVLAVAPEAIARLRDAGLPVQFLTNTTRKPKRIVVARLGCAPPEVVMVGDDAESDVARALSADLGCAVLVRTGKFRAGDETR